MRTLRLHRDDDGFVVVLAIIVILVGLLLGGAVISQVTATQNSVQRDGAGKRAVQAARAGVQAGTEQAIATAKTSWVTTSPSTAVCPGETTSRTFVSTATSPSAWCTQVTQAIGANETFAYQLSTPYTPSGSTTTARDIVATGVVTKGDNASGTSNQVTRRVRQTLTSTPGLSTNPFSVAGVIGVTSVVYVGPGGSPSIGTSTSNVDVMSGGDIDVSASDGHIYGDANPGVGKSVKLQSYATQTDHVTGDKTPVTRNPTLTSVTIPTTNDDGGIQTALNNYVGASGNFQADASWNATTRVLRFNWANTPVQLPGNTYVFCQLHMGDSGKIQFTSTNSQPVRLYFDSPANCAGASTAQTISSDCSMTSGNVRTPLRIGNGGSILNNNQYPIQAYVNGAYTIQFSGAGSATLGVLYAPQSSVDFCGSGNLLGNIAADKIRMDGATYIRAATTPNGPIDTTAISGGSAAGSGGAATYSAGTFTECSSTGGTASTSGC